jgi:hypothetical protein
MTIKLLLWDESYEFVEIFGGIEGQVGDTNALG